MAGKNEGLPNGGLTQFFNFLYDDQLSSERGEKLAADLMMHCDDDFALLKSWFSGRNLDVSPPINVNLNYVHMDGAGNPTNPGQEMGAAWSGAGLVKLTVNIGIGDVPMAEGTDTMLARYLLVAEVSEMFMRALALYPLNNWFSATDEGSQGESLSNFLSQQFLLQNFPGVQALPSQRGASFHVTSLWLNSARDKSYIDINPDDTNHNEVTGCQILFLFYLHDQLGFSIQDIINNGAETLSKLYEKLTQLKLSYIDQTKAPPDVWQNAWPKFSKFVNDHYPATVTLRDGVKSPLTIAMSYGPPLETIFPVCELDSLAVPTQATWVASGRPNLVTVGLDRQPQVPLPITFVISDPTIISSLPVLPPPPPTPPPIIISPPSASRTLQLTVLPQARSFTRKSVTLTASYAGKSLTRTIVVVRPDSMGLPPLVIDVDRSADMCQRSFVEKTLQIFRITNLDVFADQSGLVFSWSVTGAVPDATDTASLTISALPAAGTTVTINVTVKNQQNLQAAGTLSFQTAAANDLVAMTAEVHCRIMHIVNGALRLPPWVPIERDGTVKEQLAGLEKQLSQVSQEVAHGVTRVNTLIRQMRKFEG